MYRNEVEIDILPETAKCCADDKERSPLDINRYRVCYAGRCGRTIL